MDEAMEKKRVIPFVLFVFFLMGFCNFVGMAAVYMQTDFKLNDVEVGILPLLVFVWYLLLALPFRRTIKMIGRKVLAFSGISVMAIGLVLPVLTYSVAGCMLAFSLIGCGSVFVYMALEPLICSLFSRTGQTVFPVYGWMIQAISSFLGPFVTAVSCVLWGKWYFSLCVFAVITILYGGKVFSCPINESCVISSFGVRSFKKFSGTRGFWILFTTMVCINGIDVGMNIIIPKLLMERCGNTVQDAVLGSGFYFVCKAFGCLMSTMCRAHMNIRGGMLLQVSALLLSLFVLCFMYGEYGILSLSGIIGMGLSFLYFKIDEMVFTTYQESGYERVVMMQAAMCGGAFVPLLMGAASMVYGSLLGALSVLLVCFSVVVFIFLLKRNSFN